MGGTIAHYVLKEREKKDIWKGSKSALCTCRVHTSCIKRENHYILLFVDFLNDRKGNPVKSKYS